MFERQLQEMRRALSTGGGRGEVLTYLLEALLQAGMAAVVVVIPLLFAHASSFSNYMIIKVAALHFMVALLVGIWLAKAAVGGSLRLERSALYLPFLVYLAISLLSLVFAQNLGQGAEVLLTQVWLFAFCVLAFHHLRDSEAASIVLWAIVLTGLLVSGIGLLQYNGIHLVHIPAFYGDLPVSTLGNPSFVAHYLDVVIPLTLSMLVVRKRIWERVILCATLAVTSSHMVLTESRGGWLSTGFGLILLGYLILRRRQIRWGRWLIAAVLVGALVSPVAELVLDNVHLESGASLYDQVVKLAERTGERVLSSFDMNSFSISQRLIIWSDTVDLIRAHPWLGVGPGNYELFLPAFRSVPLHRDWKALMGERTHVPYHAHNEYLEIWAESGLFGLAAMLWLLGTALWLAFRFLATQEDTATRTITCGCLVGMVATLVHSLFSFNLQDPTSAVHFWLLGGLLIAVNRGMSAGGEAAGGVRFLFDRSLSRFLRLSASILALLVTVGGGYVGLCMVAGDYYYFLGRYQNEIGHPNRASLAFREAIERRSYDFRYHHMLGLMELEGGRFAAAESALRQSAELHPNSPATLRQLGRALYLRNKGEEAVSVLRRAARLDPLVPKTYSWLALAYRQQGQHPQAIETWKQALSFYPEDVGLLSSLGVEYVKDGKREEAAAVLEQATRSNPRDGQIQGNLGGVYLMMGRAEEAEAALRRATELDPDQVEWRLNLAGLYVRQDRLEMAGEQVAQALERDPDNEKVRQLVQMLNRRLQKGER